MKSPPPLPLKLFIGTYQIPVELLQDPPTFLKIRDVKEWYVDYLVEMLRTTEDDHEDLTAPLLVVASVKKEDFRMSNKDKYTYQVYMYTSMSVFLSILGRFEPSMLFIRDIIAV